MWITGVVTVLSALAGGPEPWDLARLAMSRHQAPAPEARIWLDRGVDPVPERGDRVRVFYRSSVNAYVAILQVDTDGTVRLLYPRSPSENHYTRANRDYQLLFTRSPYWYVGDRPGMGYFFVVTSPRPFDFSDFRYSLYSSGWDLSIVGNRVYEDPYWAMDDYVARLMPDWESAAYGLDFVSYSVGVAHEYPRFLCYECHGFKPFNIWNPYRYNCTNFRVVVYDDPYFYPSRRYRGDRVVFVGRSVPSGPRFWFKERARGEPGTPVVLRVPAVGRDNDLDAVDRPRRRAIPRGGAGATGVTRPTGPPNPSSDDRGARVRPPVIRRGEADRRETPSRTRGARPATTPDVQRPVLQRRPPDAYRSTEGVRATPRPRVYATRPGSSGRVEAPTAPTRDRATPPRAPVTRRRSLAPAVRRPATRPASSESVRKPVTTSRPASPPATSRPQATAQVG